MYNNDIELVSFSAIATVPPPMKIRPFKFNLNRNRNAAEMIDLEYLKEAQESTPTGEITAGVVAKIANGLLMPNDKGFALDLPGGEKEKRATFVLITRNESVAGYTYCYIQGYTDRYEVDYKDNEPSDETEFFINKITNVAATYDDYDNVHYRVKDALEVIHNKHTDSYEYESELDTVTRSSDIVNESIARSIGRDNPHNAAATLSTDGLLVRQGEKTGSGLLKSVINSMSLSTDGNSGVVDNNTYLSASTFLVNPDSRDIPLLQALDDIRDDVRLSISTSPTSFTYRELRTILPEIGGDESVIVEYDEDAIVDGSNFDFSHDEDSMLSDTELVSFVSEFLNFILFTLSSHRMKSISFSMDNFETDGDDVDFEIIDEPIFFIRGLDDGFKKKMLKAFFRRVKNDYFIPKTDGNNRELLIAIFINDDFEGKIIIEGTDIPEIQFPVTPSFSGITSPLLNNASGLRKMTTEISSILDNM